MSVQPSGVQPRQSLAGHQLSPARHQLNPAGHQLRLVVNQDASPSQNKTCLTADFDTLSFLTEPFLSAGADDGYCSATTGIEYFVKCLLFIY